MTFSFFSIDDWHDRLRERHTITRWYDEEVPGRDVSLADLVVTPERVNTALAKTGGRLDLISSHLGLIDIDLELAARLGGATTFDSYDLVLIDCAPNFGLVTKTAIVASEHILVPAKADYLSTLGWTTWWATVRAWWLTLAQHAYVQEVRLNSRMPVLKSVWWTISRP